MAAKGYRIRYQVSKEKANAVTEYAMDLKIACESAGTLPFSEMTEFQGELKSLSKEDYEKLRRQLETSGYSFPISIWKAPDGLNYILDGHQRLRTIKAMVADGWEIPDLPVSYTEASTYKEAKQKLLAAASQFGKMESQGLYEFLIDADLSVDDLVLNNRFADLDIDSFNKEFFNVNNPEDFEFNDPGESNLDPDTKLSLLVKLVSESDQDKLFTELRDRGFNVKAV